MTSELKLRARKLRNNPTQAEALFWECLRKNQLGYKFLRQKVIGCFVVDFYCAQKKLVVEIDGPIHLSQKEYDQERTEFLGLMGIRVVRFTNDEVFSDLEGCVERLKSTLDPSFLKKEGRIGPPLLDKRGARGDFVLRARGDLDYPSYPPL